MDTIVVNGKTFVVKKGNDFCHKCLFCHGNDYPNQSSYCLKTKCNDFVVIREANVIDRIRMWLKKKIKK